MHRMVANSQTKKKTRKIRCLLKCRSKMKSLKRTTRSFTRLFSLIKAKKSKHSQIKMNWLLLKKLQVLSTSFSLGQSTSQIWTSSSMSPALSRLNTRATIQCQKTDAWPAISSIWWFVRWRIQATSTVSPAQLMVSTKMIALSAFLLPLCPARKEVSAIATLWLAV